MPAELLVEDQQVFPELLMNKKLHLPTKKLLANKILLHNIFSILLLLKTLFKIFFIGFTAQHLIIFTLLPISSLSRACLLTGKSVQNFTGLIGICTLKPRLKIHYYHTSRRYTKLLMIACCNIQSENFPCNTGSHVTVCRFC